ncbi:MAG TPA: SLBB domain-containing protein [Candidatus Izemoplasmatales bacterium]|nr:SLBB domain-containing protein [Candidatus Izemoplasmatales bacterium]
MKYVKKYYGIVIGLVVLVLFGLSFVQSNKSDGNTPTNQTTDWFKPNQKSAEIKGEIKTPGIYEFEEGNRIVDIINMAGGLTGNADISSINRSERVIDEMVIVIPNKQNNPGIPSEIQRFIQVEIKGEVLEPGIYKIPEQAILMDLVDMAGGFTEQADTKNINLAQKLSNQSAYQVGRYEEELIFVEVKGQVNQPGVYEMLMGDIVSNIINKAGGLTSQAYTEDINMAASLHNHQVITIHHYHDMQVEKATEIKGAVKEPGVYYFFEELRVIDLIQMAGGFTNLADYSEINLSAFVKDTDVFRVPEIENELTIAIDLKGQVKYPGVYYMKEGARIIDLVRLAGGFRPDADTSEINLSELLEDEDIVKVNKIDNDQNYIYVEIKGEVFLPGIYALRPGTRLIMLLNRAGGLTIFANDSELNRTRELVDGEIIVIPSIEEEDEEEEEEEEEENIPVEESYYIKITGAVFDPGIYLLTEGLTMMDVINSAGGLTIEADLSQIDFSFLVSENASIHIISTNELTTEIPDVSEERLNINIASVDELQSLSGIGIILAERIIEYRESNGPFDSIEAIMDVSGIGESIYDQIKDDITV